MISSFKDGDESLVAEFRRGITEEVGQVMKVGVGQKELSERVASPGIKAGG
jgi:hypothetical protein